MKEKKQTLDLSFLKEFCEDDNKKMIQYIHTFLETAPDEFRSMRSASTSKQWMEVKSIAHQLKPQIKFIGLPAVLLLVEKIEAASMENEEKTVLSLIVELEKAMEDATDSLIQTLVTLS